MMKHTFYAVAMMAFILFLAACDRRKEEPDTSASATLTIVHTNDFHSQFDPLQPPGEPSQGGAARLKTLIDGIRAEKGEQNVLLVNAGDNFQGTMFYNAWKGSAEVMKLNHLRFDAITLGNHEFDLGPEELARALAGGRITISGTEHETEAARFLTVASNTDARGVPELNAQLVKRAVIHKGGQRYGIIGVTTETTKNVSSPGEHVHFTDYLASVQEQVAALQAQGVNKIILLSHSGSDEDMKRVPYMSGVDVIIAGHDHALFGDKEAIAAMGLPEQAKRVKSPYPTVMKDKDGHNVLIVSAMEKGRWLGRIDVTFDANGVIRNGAWKAAPIFVRGCDGEAAGAPADCPEQAALPDAALGTLIERYRAPMETLANEHLGVAEVDFTGRHDAGAENLYSMGNLTADIILAYVRRTEPAQAAVINRGGMRAHLAKGDVYYKDVSAVLPFDNRVAVVELTGEELLEAMDVAVDEAGDQSYGAYPHVADMTIRYCPKRGCKQALRKGGRVTELTVQGQEFDMDARYRIATNDYLMTGGDFYTVFKTACAQAERYCRNTGALLRDVVADWFRNHSPVGPASQGRVVMAP